MKENSKEVNRASDAAALVKATAENTAMALNIQYIQRDITDIKQAQKDNAAKLEIALRDINEKDEFFVSKKEFEDHESRIRKTETNVTKILTWGTAALVILGIAEFILNQYLSNR